MLNERQDKILDLVIESFIASAEPVGSRFLLGEKDVACGEATIRNELRALEEAGYLTHPHTSSGRVPTVKGYRHYLEKTDWPTLRLDKKEDGILTGLSGGKTDPDTRVKNMAKTLAELSGQAVIVAFSPSQIYYTGLANIFSQPEFGAPELIGRVSLLFDRCEDCLADFLAVVEKEPRCFIGRDQPFGEVLSLVAGRGGRAAEAMIILGPMRMNYRRNYSLLKKVLTII